MMRNRTCLVTLTIFGLALASLGVSWPTFRALAGEPNSETSATADKVPAAAAIKARRRCQAQCDSENGECNSEVRRSRQECSKEAATGGNDPFSGRPEAFDYYCGYFDIAQCQNSVCANRFARRYAECVQFMRGSVTSRRFDCIRAETKARGLCRAELRDCRVQCQ
jgi:hypothetical protein